MLHDLCNLYKQEIDNNTDFGKTKKAREEMLKYAEEAYSLADKNKDLSGKAVGAYFSGVALEAMKNYSEAEKKYQSWLELREQKKTDTIAQIFALRGLGEYYLRQYSLNPNEVVNLDKADVCYDKIYNLRPEELKNTQASLNWTSFIQLKESPKMFQYTEKYLLKTKNGYARDFYFSAGKYHLKLHLEKKINSKETKDIDNLTIAESYFDKHVKQKVEIRPSELYNNVSNLYAENKMFKKAAEWEWRYITSQYQNSQKRADAFTIKYGYEMGFEYPASQINKNPISPEDIEFLTYRLQYLKQDSLGKEGYKYLSNAYNVWGYRFLGNGQEEKAKQYLDSAIIYRTKQGAESERMLFADMSMFVKKDEYASIYGHYHKKWANIEATRREYKKVWSILGGLAVWQFENWENEVTKENKVAKPIQALDTYKEMLAIAEKKDTPKEEKEAGINKAYSGMNIIITKVIKSTNKNNILQNKMADFLDTWLSSVTKKEKTKRKWLKNNSKILRSEGQNKK